MRAGQASISLIRNRSWRPTRKPRDPRPFERGPYSAWVLTDRCAASSDTVIAGSVADVTDRKSVV